jgi:hypothetical protein
MELLAGSHYSSLYFVSALDSHVMFVLYPYFVAAVGSNFLNRCLLDSFMHIYMQRGWNYIFPFLKK